MDLFDFSADHNGSVSSPVEAAQGFSSPLVTFDQVFNWSIFIFVEFQLAPFDCFIFYRYLPRTCSFFHLCLISHAYLYINVSLLLMGRYR
jgi:hypothetical protein